MMEYYLDDSGTHKDSRVMVWGGVIGYKEFFNELEVAWKARLAHPCDGRPPIKAFHSSHLAASDGEFEGYSEAERNLTRYNFRKVIVDAGLSILSLGISVDDWENIVTEPARLIFRSAERFALGRAVIAGYEAVKEEKQPLSIQIDKGRRSSELDTIIQPALDVAEGDGQFVSCGFSTVSETMGLQAADLVAHETYQLFIKYIDDRDTSPGPHLKKLFENARDARADWLGREQIQSMVDKIGPAPKMIEPSAEK